HTRCLSDWSSDVCSSDLKLRGAERIAIELRGIDANNAGAEFRVARSDRHQRPLEKMARAGARLVRLSRHQRINRWRTDIQHEREIGRASCRERRESEVVD